MQFRTIGLWVILIALFVAFYQVFQRTEEDVAEVSFTTFLNDVRDGKVTRVRIKGTRYSGLYNGTNARFRTTGPVADASMMTTLQNGGVDVEIMPVEEGGSVWLNILSQWLPISALLAFFIFFARQLRKNGAKIPQRKLKPQALPDPGPLQGLDEARARLRAAADGIKNKRPGTRRVLLSGPPGTGKTALVKAAAADSGLEVLAIAGSDFVETFVGTGAKLVRELFEAAEKLQPVIIVIEDLDAIAKARAPNTPDKSQDERDQTLLELCQWLDGLKKFPDRVLLIATTNRPDLLDAAITRPGRFELHVKLGNRTATLEG